MLVQSYTVRLKKAPDEQQLEVLRQYNVNLDGNTARTTFTARMIDSNAQSLRSMTDWVKAVYVNDEPTLC